MSLAYFAVSAYYRPMMTSPMNLSNLSSNMWPLLALVIGQVFVLIVGGIDLSATSVMAVTSVLGAMLMTTSLDPAKFAKNPLWGVILSENGGPLADSSLAVPTAICLMLLAGALIGLVNGCAVARLKMPPFIVTLVSMFFFGGLAIYLTRSENIMYLPKVYTAIGQGALWHVATKRAAVDMIPYSFFVAVPLGLLAYIILQRTVLGRWFYAVGQNIKTAAISGVPTERVIILAYVFSGLCAAIGSILYSSRLGIGSPTIEQDSLLDIIGAAVIGGVSLFGGKGKVICVAYGVLFFTILDNSLNMMNLDFYTVDIAKGCIILLAALLDVTRVRLAAGEHLGRGAV
jgi:ribose transport system permease protein